MQFSLATLFCLIGFLFGIRAIGGSQTLTIYYNGVRYKCDYPICKIYISCVIGGDATLCNSYVVLIGRIDNKNKTFIPCATGALLRNTDLLTTVSSGLGTVFYEHDEWIFLRHKDYGTASECDGHLLSNQDARAQLIPGDFDPHGWNDILLIRRKENHGLTGVFIANDEEKLEVLTGSSIKRYALKLVNNTYVIEGSKEIAQRVFHRYNASQCQEMFAYDENVFFDEDLMYCDSDEDMESPPPPELAKFLSGLPVFARWRESRMMIGIRSLQSTDPQHRGVFLVTKMKYHCPWLEYHRAGGQELCKDK